MEPYISLTELNDFIFCPASLYYHNFYRNRHTHTFQSTDQTAGASVHQSIDTQTYSTKKNIIQGLVVFSERLQIGGKIDIYLTDENHLIERKRKVKMIYDGYIYQLYGQCICLREMGYDVEQLSIYSLIDNKRYSVPLPENDYDCYQAFLRLIQDMRSFDLNEFRQDQPNKCQRCIYAPACDRYRGG